MMSKEMRKVKKTMKNKKNFKNLKQILDRDGHFAEIKGTGENKYNEKFVIAVSIINDFDLLELLIKDYDYSHRGVFTESFTDFAGIIVYAIPFNGLDSVEKSLSSFPNAIFYISTLADGASTQKSVMQHIKKVYSMYEEKHLYAYRLDSINIPEKSQSTGIGTMLLEAAKKEMAYLNAENHAEGNDEFLTHIYAELPPTDEYNRYPDLVHFYQENGFILENHPVITHLI